MSIVFYHANLKTFHQEKLTKSKDLDYYKKIGSKLILDGFKKGYDVKKQIEFYIHALHTYQNIKIYNLTREDKEYYVSCILALWKLEIIDPDSPTDPFFIAPLRKIKPKV
tara:strand:+ start:2855 stop:3184 length:330 start_codon:yes stop_codon:yes gene_type:complete